MPIDTTHESMPQTATDGTFSVTAAVRRIIGLCANVYAWLENWRAADAAKQQLEMMNDRDLLDIGMTRADIRRAARGTSIRTDPYGCEWL